MTEVYYIAPEDLDADEDDAHAFLRVGDTVHIVPSFPEVELCPAAPEWV